jgi:hypothetical protein
MTALTSHLSAAELEARYETAADPVMAYPEDNSQIA